MAEAGGLFQGVRKEYADIVMVLAVVGILLAMLLPVPAFLLDFFLALNITLAIIVLITTMYTKRSLEFSIFPTMLLVLTLFRLALNVASTRLILLRGNEGPQAAGTVIQSFGNFVVGGDYVVGLIIFVILVLINFMVITKGAGRIAEVAARFTLDAMPGKQMAIDADLNAGIIDEREAKERRMTIARESEFHGSMDGASKFVKGDAIAGIIITGINLVGGLIIGVLAGMPVGQAAANYTLLTVGDGLVTQIPALIISTAAGILVSRGGEDDRLGQAFSKLIFSKTTPIYVASCLVFALGLVPGLPGIPFMSLGLALGGTLYLMSKGRSQEEAAEKEAAGEEDAAAPVSGPEEVEHLLNMDAMELEVGYGLIPLVDSSQDGTLLSRIRSMRRQFATEMGIVIPPIHIRDNLNLRPAEYRMLIKGVEMARYELMVNHVLAMDPGDVSRRMDGFPTTEPAFGLQAIWISADLEEEAKFSGYTVVDNSTVVATHLTEIIRSNVAELLGRQEVQHLLDNLAKNSPKAVEELVPSIMSLGMVQKVLQNLLAERVSVRDLLTIVETLADYGTMSKDPDLLTEYVRQKLSRSILAPYMGPDGNLPVLTLDRKLEETLTKSIQNTEHGAYLAVDPRLAEQLMAGVRGEMEKALNQNIQPVLLCNPSLRRHLRRLLEQNIPTLAVTSHAEIVQNVNIQAIGKVTL
ncbi:flagellar biosynthesis protein FlhA [Desulfobotulus alkaliphilus]|uniref:Flagellar biosynthesis protein FlhA n=1 Tax=Desulfobotulus alkaliphilus TaxID=622671 RepID=A0A562RTH5_9BACT|nr:flagellar biosynthesis protein FlhA [Desulfobotulus alkaliphilus]TWI72401.1 flagellar biosynthesis protein FlhA [Desulfobotulus alkaliphilus]